VDPRWLEILAQWLGILMTAAVGLAGVGGLVWTGHKERRASAEQHRKALAAEINRLALADKRQTYAAFLSKLHAVWSATIEVSNPAYHVGEAGQSVRSRANTAIADLETAYYELLLIAPESVWLLASDIRKTARGELVDALSGSMADRAENREGSPRTDLVRAMRADIEGLAQAVVTEAEQLIPHQTSA
jgi:hypothetical protein